MVVSGLEPQQIYGSFFNQNTQPLSEWHSGDVVSLIGAEGWINSNTFFLWNHTTNEMPQVYKPE